MKSLLFNKLCQVEYVDLLVGGFLSPRVRINQPLVSVKQMGIEYGQRSGTSSRTSIKAGPKCIGLWAKALYPVDLGRGGMYKLTMNIFLFCFQ